MSLSLLVLAAGMGSRFGGLKQIDPVGPGGETIIDYSVHDAIRAGFDRLVFVIRRDIEEPFKKTIGARFERQLPVRYVYQELDKLPTGFAPPANRRKPWGTGHAILMAAEEIDGPFAAINGDDFYGMHSFELLGRHLRDGGEDWAMVGFVLRNTLSEFGQVARGVCHTSPDGWLQSVTEVTSIEKDGAGAKFTNAAGQKQSLTGDEVVSLNLWGFTPALFGHLRREFTTFLEQRQEDERAEFYIPTAVNTLVAAGRVRVKVLPTSDSWFGVTYREDRAHAVENIAALIRRGDYPQKLSAQG
jgi:NDP-sugar pyrophosphorylase family protein